MVYKITAFSQEVEDFVMEIKIDADCTFYDLHRLLLKACGYEENSRQRFMICNEDWRVEKRILLEDTGEYGIDEDVYVMDDTILEDHLEEEGQRFAYVFNPEEKRLRLMELSENIFSKSQPEPIVSRSHGTAPAQYEEEEIETKPTETSTELGEEFYGDDGFDADEIDMEGFEINED